MTSCRGCVALNRMLTKERMEHQAEIKKFSCYIEAVLKRNAELERAVGDPMEAEGDQWMESQKGADEGVVAAPELSPPAYKLPLVPSEKVGAHVVLCPPVVGIPAVDRLPHKLAVGVLKKYEKVFIEAADRYEKWARSNVPPEAKRFDNGTEWIFLHLSLFKAANPIPSSNLATIYSPSAVLRWHNAYQRFIPEDDRFLTELKKRNIKPITKIEDLKKFIKNNT